MDVFTDTEILCDLLEAANKRMVFVYLLLDHGNINLFSEMCDKLQIAEDLFKVLWPCEALRLRFVCLTLGSLRQTHGDARVSPPRN